MIPSSSRSRSREKASRNFFPTSGKAYTTIQGCSAITKN